MNRGGRGIFAAGGIAVAFGVYLVAAGGAVFLAPLLNSSVPVTRPAGTAVTTTRSGTATNDDSTQTPQVVSVAANVGRYHSVKGLLSESSATNLALQSEDFATTWAVLNTTVTPNAATAPDGTLTADRAAVSNGTHYLRQSAITVTASTAYVFSFWAKNNSGTTAAYSIFNASASTDIVASTSYLSSINGSTWTRVSVAFTTPVGCTSVIVYPLRDSGAGADLFLWGAQLETGSVATSYIRTTTGTVTRSADVSTCPTTGWPTGSGEISVVYTPLSGTNATDAVLMDTRTTSTTQGLVVYRDTSNRVQFFDYAAALTCSALTAAQTWTPGTAKTVEVRWTPTTCEVVIDGVSAATGVATGSPASHDPTANIGSSLTGTAQASGWVSTLCVGRACP